MLRRHEKTHNSTNDEQTEPPLQSVASSEQNASVQEAGPLQQDASSERFVRKILYFMRLQSLEDHVAN